MKVGNEEVKASDLDIVIRTLNPQQQKELQTRGRKPLGDQYALVLLLSQQAQSHHLDSTPAFQKQLAMQRRQMLAEAAYSEITGGINITPQETSKYYEAHKSEFEEAQLRQVVVLKRAEGAKEGARGFPAEEAKTRIEAIRKALADGTDPKKVAEQFQVPNQILVDSEPRTAKRGTMRPEMEKAAFSLKDGEFSETFDLTQALVFFQVVGRHTQDLKDVTPQIENSLRQEKVNATLEDLKKKGNVWMDDAYFAAPASAPASAPSQSPATKPPAQQ